MLRGDGYSWMLRVKGGEYVRDDGVGDAALVRLAETAVEEDRDGRERARLKPRREVAQVRRALSADVADVRVAAPVHMHV